MPNRNPIPFPSQRNIKTSENSEIKVPKAKGQKKTYTLICRKRKGNYKLRMLFSQKTKQNRRQWSEESYLIMKS
jgi:hypothetical protein